MVVVARLSNLFIGQEIYRATFETKAGKEDGRIEFAWNCIPSMSDAADTKLGTERLSIASLLGRQSTISSNSRHYS